MTRLPPTGVDPGAGTAPVAWLERQLLARDKTIAVLMRRVEDRQLEQTSAMATLEQNVSLARIISRKTSELERERAELKAALEALRMTQVRLLQAQKMESIGQLAAGVAHEINTPTQYVSDNIRFLSGCFEKVLALLDAAVAVVAAHRDGGPSPEQLADAETWIRRSRLDFLRPQIPAALEQSLEGLTRIGSIVSAMKDFSHPSLGEKEPVDIADIIRTAVTVSRNEWKYVAELTTEFSAELPLVPCLRDELSQVVLNLIVNAAHAIGETMEEGQEDKGRIGISTARYQDQVEIRVSDSGCGIPERIRGRIFDPFFTTKPVGQGTGQGLAIVYSTVVEKHGGQVFFETEEGRGTTFVVRLPLQPETATAHAATRP